MRRLNWLVGAALVMTVACDKGEDQSEQASSEPQAAASTAPAAAPTPVQSTETMGSNGLLKDDVSFKKEADVKALWGEPAATYKQPDRVSWYYRRKTKDRFGQDTYPELQFMDGEVRFTVMWPIDTMEDKIKTAELNGGVEPQPVTRTRTYTMEEFYGFTQGKAKADILQNLGEPDEKRMMQGKEVWQYNKIVSDQNVTRSFAIQFEGDVANEIHGG